MKWTVKSIVAEVLVSVLSLHFKSNIAIGIGITFVQSIVIGIVNLPGENLTLSDSVEHHPLPLLCFCDSGTVRNGLTYLIT